MGTDGPGPDHCRACRSARPEGGKCADCPEPDLLPEAEPILDWWLAAQTQWRVGMHGPTGLDYAGLAGLQALRGEAPDPERFAGVQICERAALTALRDRREREQLGQLMGAH
jgi:hypothetical protein